MRLETELNESEVQKPGDFLARVWEDPIQNAEGTDGFFAALVCCPDLIMPSEFMPVLLDCDPNDILV